MQWRSQLQHERKGSHASRTAAPLSPHASHVIPTMTFLALTACRCALQSAVASDRAVRPAASPSAPRQQAPRPPSKQPEAPPPGRKLGFSDSGASSSSGVGELDSSGARAANQAAPASPSSSPAAVNGLQARSSSAGEPSGWVTVDGAAQSDAGRSSYLSSAGQPCPISYKAYQPYNQICHW
jgi:hypothetical protein